MILAIVEDILCAFDIYKHCLCWIKSIVARISITRTMNNIIIGYTIIKRLHYILLNEMKVVSMKKRLETLL